MDSLENCDIPVDRTRDEFDLCNICIVILLLDRKLIRAGMGNIPIQYVIIWFGVLGTIVGAFLTYAILTFAYGEGYGAFVNMDTFLSEHDVYFLAYASMFPEMEVYLYMILPIKVKWLGYLDGLYLIYIFLSSGFTVAGISVKVSIVAALLKFSTIFLLYEEDSKNGSKLQG